ncbi:MAG: hypothetical protein IBJ18_11935 [Phycisphaerales bacterium]|nr:hypothetical protein [Phycisphaerales bacterium]
MEPSVVIVGVLDGVHWAHGRLVQRARALARSLAGDGSVAKTPRVVALSFDPHPQTTLRPEALPPARLSTFDQRRAWLREAGADEVVALSPTKELLSQDPLTFVQSLRTRFNAVGMVEGHDFRFGQKRAGDTTLLQWLGTKLGMAVEIVQPVEAVLHDHSVVTVSSSLVRWLITHGRVGDAALLLGRAYEITGTVVQGDRRGRQLNFPTANIRTEHHLPVAGVYACSAVLPNGAVHPAAVNVGARPTFENAPPTLEAHVILSPDRAGDDSVIAKPWSTLPDLPEYGWEIRLRFHHMLRDQVKFASLDALKAQLARDVRRTVEFGSDAVSPPPVSTSLPETISRT